MEEESTPCSPTIMVPLLLDLEVRRSSLPCELDKSPDPTAADPPELGRPTSTHDSESGVKIRKKSKKHSVSSITSVGSTEHSPYIALMTDSMSRKISEDRSCLSATLSTGSRKRQFSECPSHSSITEEAKEELDEVKDTLRLPVRSRRLSPRHRSPQPLRRAQMAMGDNPGGSKIFELYQNRVRGRYGQAESPETEAPSPESSEDEEEPTRFNRQSAARATWSPMSNSMRQRVQQQQEEHVVGSRRALIRKRLQKLKLWGKNKTAEDK